MNKSLKNIFMLGIIILILIFVLIRGDNNLKVPNSKELNSIILVDVIEDEGIKKTIIYKESDINNMLSILDNSQKIRGQSTSQLPEKTEFTIVLFEFHSDDISWRCIYKEKDNLYIDQPFAGIFKIEEDNLSELNDIIKKGSEEIISVRVEDIGSIIKIVPNRH